MLREMLKGKEDQCEELERMLKTLNQEISQLRKQADSKPSNNLRIDISNTNKADSRDHTLAEDDALSSLLGSISLPKFSIDSDRSTGINSSNIIIKEKEYQFQIEQLQELLNESESEIDRLKKLVKSFKRQKPKRIC
ncbi:hypothetical protein BKA69DRAFT_543192 [Paraphysoderma sedebokerense]|nr:hypothetical protein BKA69DRAFT_543192 [Paraphysoderma sedebokerense]